MERPREKQRHGCLTAWLILLMIMTALGVIASLFFSSKMLELAPETPAWAIPLSTVLGLLNLACLFALFKWKKVGFWGLAALTLAGIAINVVAGGLKTPLASFGGPLISFLILFGVLHIGKEDKGWPQLE